MFCLLLALQGSVTHLTAASAIIKAIQIHDKTATKSVLLQKKRYATNSNMEKQLRFYSTKKRRVTTSRWAKPNEEDICNSKATHEFFWYNSMWYMLYGR